MKYIETETIKTRKALVEEVYNKMIQAGNKHTRAEITEMSNLVFDTISEWMSNKEKIAIRGIGTFSPCWREHAVYNFHTHERLIGQKIFCYKLKLSEKVKNYVEHLETNG